MKIRYKFAAALGICAAMFGASAYSTAQAAPPVPVMERHLQLNEVAPKEVETPDIFRRVRMLSPGRYVERSIITGAGFNGRKSGSATVVINLEPDKEFSCTPKQPINTERTQRLFSKEICLLLTRHGKFSPALGRDGQPKAGQITLSARFHSAPPGTPIPGNCPPECSQPLVPYPGQYAKVKKEQKNRDISWLPADQYTKRFFTAKVWVTRKGKAKTCHIQQSSGTDIGDYRLCRHALKKLKYKPGRAPPPASGKAKKIDDYANVTFEMPWPRII